MKVDVAWADLARDDFLRKNLVLLGGAGTNEISRAFLDKTRPTLHCRGGHGGFVISDRTEGIDHSSTVMGSESRSGTDYCIIIRAANPFDPQKQVLYIGGAYGYGTWAGVRYALSDEFCKNAIVTAKAGKGHRSGTGKPFECLLATEVFRDAPLGIRLVVIRELSQTAKD
jgi:hypothetical protein